jgi:hypothetical protein
MASAPALVALSTVLLFVLAPAAAKALTEQASLHAGFSPEPPRFADNNQLRLQPHHERRHRAIAADRA